MEYLEITPIWGGFQELLLQLEFDLHVLDFAVGFQSELVAVHRQLHLHAAESTGHFSNHERNAFSKNAVNCTYFG